MFSGGILGVGVRLRLGFSAPLDDSEDVADSKDITDSEDIADTGDIVDSKVVEAEEAGEHGGAVVPSSHSKGVPLIDSLTTSPSMSFSLSLWSSSGKLCTIIGPFLDGLLVFPNADMCRSPCLCAAMSLDSIVAEQSVQTHINLLGLSG